jgi:hypothetical protein
MSSGHSAALPSLSARLKDALADQYIALEKNAAVIRRGMKRNARAPDAMKKVETKSSVEPGEKPELSPRGFGRHRIIPNMTTKKIIP